MTIFLSFLLQLATTPVTRVPRQVMLTSVRVVRTGATCPTLMGTGSELVKVRVLLLLFESILVRLFR